MQAPGELSALVPPAVAVEIIAVNEILTPNREEDKTGGAFEIKSKGESSQRINLLQLFWFH